MTLISTVRVMVAAGASPEDVMRELGPEHSFGQVADALAQVYAERGAIADADAVHAEHAEPLPVGFDELEGDDVLLLQAGLELLAAAEPARAAAATALSRRIDDAQVILRNVDALPPLLP